MKNLLLSSLVIFLLSSVYLPGSIALPAEDVRVVKNEQYGPVAQELIKGAKNSIRIVMFEMAYYEQHQSTPTNVLIRELIGAKKRGVKVEVILEIKEADDRTTRRNRRTGKILSEGGVDVLYDSPSKTTHTKMMIVDDHLVLLGSTNWTYNALTDNNEVSVLIRSKEVAKDLTEYFNKLRGTGTKK